MNVTLNMGIGIVPIITNALAYAGIAYFAYKQYQKQALKPSVWKMIIVMLVGLFSFSFDWSMSNTMLRFAILPLGVWLIFLVCRGNKHKHRWQKYRSFAWLGFGANYLLLAATLLSIPLQNVFYPSDKPTTYLANLSKASLITIHPSAEQSVFIDISQLEEQLAHMMEVKIDSQGWYLDIHDRKINEQEVVEKFPYMIVDVKGRWGSGYYSLIYVEHDGKGILITNNKNQYYYRFEQSIVMKGE